MLAIQISLGIATLLHVVPIPLAASHQGGALLLFAASLWVTHRLREFDTRITGACYVYSYSGVIARMV